MKLDYLYYIGLFLALLAEVMPLVMPVHTPELADAFFLIYLASVKRVRYSKAYVTWMAAVLAFFAISTTWALDVKLSLWGLRQVIVIFIGMLATYSYLKSDPDSIKNILVVFLAESIVLIVFIIINLDQIEMGIRLGKQFGDEESQKVNSNVIGMNFCYALYVVFVLLGQSNKSFWKRVLVIAASVFLIYLILFTGSRKALLMIAIPLLVFPLLQKNKSKGTVFLVAVAGLLIIGSNLIMDIPIFYDVIGSRVEDGIAILTGREQGTEDVSRIFLAQYGLEWFKENPSFGYGINCFRVLSNKTSMFAGYNFYAHNNYVELLVDVGLIGFLIYYSCFFFFWKNLKRHFMDIRLNKWIASLIIIHLVLDMAMVSYYSFTSNLILCLCFYAVEITRKGKNHFKQLQNVKYETSRYNTALQHKCHRWAYRYS